jgi:predicted RNA-binding protein associated with RNAse of E/G family
LKRPQDRHSISAAWHEQTGDFHWYIDLTSPLRRTPTGFELVEHGLDIVADSDAGAFHWKDEDEVAWAVARGIYTPTEAADLYAEGERAAERLRRERAVLERWIGWEPDPRWAAPQLPTGWDSD